MTSVVLGMPVRGGISLETFESLRAMSGPITKVFTTGYIPIQEGRNHLFRRFLKETDGDYFLSTSTDMIYQPDALELLLAADKPIVVGVYHMKVYPFSPLIYERLGKVYIGYPKDRPFKIHSAGLDCALFKREVIEEIGDPWFKVADHMGEDIWFAANAAKHGHDLWCEPRVQCGHLARVVIDQHWAKNARWGRDLLNLEALPHNKSPPLAKAKFDLIPDKEEKTP